VNSVDGEDCRGTADINSNFSTVHLVVYAEEWSRGSNFSSVPAVVKAALLAFRDPDILPNGLAAQVPRFEVEIIDTMCQGKDGIVSACDEIEDPGALMEAVLDGERLGCARFPRPRAAVDGGRRGSSVELLAGLAGSRGIPTMGFGTWAGDQSVPNAAEHPNYFRMRPDSGYAVRNVVRMLKHDLGFDNVTFWYCDEPYGREMLVQALQEAARVRLALFEVEVAPADSSDMPPSIDSPLGQAWYGHADRAKEIGSRAHILAMSDRCPLYNFMSFIAWMGLVGPGMFWTAFYPIERLAEGYIPFFNRYRDTGTPYAGQMPFDHLHNLDFDMPRAAETNLTRWWDSLAEDVFEPWLREYNWVSLGAQNQELFEPFPPARGPDSPPPEGGALQENYLFDALYAVQLAVTLAITRHGQDFTDMQLSQELAQVDFAGLTGRVSLDDVGERIQSLYLAEYQQSCGS
jgi:hypothetical protein